MSSAKAENDKLSDILLYFQSKEYVVIFLQIVSIQSSQRISISIVMFSFEGIAILIKIIYKMVSNIS